MSDVAVRKPFVGEVLQRQGWVVRGFDTPEEASSWCESRIKAEDGTANLVRDSRVREAHFPNTPPNAPALTFDEAWS